MCLLCLICILTRGRDLINTTEEEMFILIFPVLKSRIRAT